MSTEHGNFLHCVPMCGFAGLISNCATKLTTGEIARSMSLALCHRGPDDEGVYTRRSADPVVLLVHRRLAIIDRSPSGHQPMAAGAVTLVFNGEIYNFRELRSELEALGHHFRSGTDTEVLLSAYEEWGEHCVSRLRGIFAFALWDESSQTMFLARDHLGVKPLYYWADRNQLIFASEVRALLASRVVPPKLDRAALCGYLSYGAVQDPQTLIEGVRSLQPGHRMVWRNGTMTVQRYWNLPLPQDDPRLSFADVREQMRAHLDSAVQSQLVADVPLAAFLSGGIDSTAIVALMKEAGADTQTVSVVFDEPQYDEREFSRKAASYYGTTHHELLLRPEDVVGGLETALHAYDQPSMDGLNTYFVAKATREAGLVVALSGTGGDEVFGGYDGHARQLLAERAGRMAGRIPAVLRAPIASAVRGTTGSERARRLAELLTTERHPYFLTHQVFSPHQIRGMLLKEFMAPLGSWEPATFDELEQFTQDTDPITRTSTFELRTFMLSILLRDTDQMSMAHALEVRTPLLDHRLVEYVFSLPGRLRLDSAYPKPLLSRTLADELPAECVFRRKQGFELPFARWLKDALSDRMRSSFLDTTPATARPFSQGGLVAHWKDFEGGRLRWSRVWSIFVLREWLARHQVEL